MLWKTCIHCIEAGDAMWCDIMEKLISPCNFNYTFGVINNYHAKNSVVLKKITMIIILQRLFECPKDIFGNVKQQTIDV